MDDLQCGASRDARCPALVTGNHERVTIRVGASTIGNQRLLSVCMSGSGATQQSLLRDVDALVAAFMSDAPLGEIIPLVDRIATAADHWGDIPDRAIIELRSAIELMCEGKACATISALLAARSQLIPPPRDHEAKYG